MNIRSWGAMLAACSLLSFSAKSQAGSRVSVPVTIDFNAQTAQGAMGSAYHSTDNSQMIGCYMSANISGITGFCAAVNAQNQQRMCVFRDALAFQALQVLTPDTALSFGWDSNNNCTFISVVPISVFEPK